jgi:hypothetical protein
VPSAVPPSFGVCRTHRDRRPGSSLAIGAARYRWRSAPEPTGVAPGARRSVRRLPGPFPAAAVPVRTSHRISGSTHDGYSSRSQPCLRDVPGRMAGRPDGVKWCAVACHPDRRAPPGPARTRRTGRPATPDSAGTAHRSPTAHTTRTSTRAPTARPERTDTRHKGRRQLGSPGRQRRHRRPRTATTLRLAHGRPSARRRRARERAHSSVRERARAADNAAMGRPRAGRHGGEGGIRTHELFRVCAFQERRLQPLGHLSRGREDTALRPMSGHSGP